MPVGENQCDRIDVVQLNIRQIVDVSIESILIMVDPITNVHVNLTV